MRKKLTMPKNAQAFVDKYGKIGSKEQDAAFWKEFRKAANAYANVQAKRICDLEHALSEARRQRDRLAETLQNVINEDGTPISIDRADETLQSLNLEP